MTCHKQITNICGQEECFHPMNNSLSHIKEILIWRPISKQTVVRTFQLIAIKDYYENYIYTNKRNI